MNGNGDARNNDFSTHDDSQTTNHIYLHPGPNQGEFDNWMRRIGSLLQVSAEYAALKPALDLIIAVFEPERLFLIPHPALPELDVDACIEILVVMDGSKGNSKKLTKGMLDIACFQQKNVVMHFETATRIERGIEDGHPHFCTVCTEEHLVFSGSPYRLAKPTEETLEKLKDELPGHMDKLFAQTAIFLSEAERLMKEQSSKLTVLILHQCLSCLYKGALYTFNHTLPKTHRLHNLKRKVSKIFPQIGSQISYNTFYALDSTHEAIAVPYYNIDHICNVERVFDEVAKALKVAKAAFEKRTGLLSGGSSNLHQSGGIEQPAAPKKSVEQLKKELAEISGNSSDHKFDRDEANDYCK